MGMGRPHALLISIPGQGHVKPFMELSHRLIDRGFTITFVNTESTHARVVATLPKTGSDCDKQIRLVAIPDGMESDEDRKNIARFCDNMLCVMPRALEELIVEINASDGDKITCIIADASMGWALDVARKVGIPGAAFWPTSVGLLNSIFRIPKLIEAGVINEDGFPSKEKMIELSPTMPAMNKENFVWLDIGNPTAQTSLFRCLNYINQAVKENNWILCNSFYEIEPSACDLAPRILPIGPLLAGSRLGALQGNFWPEDSTCISWLDEQPTCSVVYIAFGSVTIFDRHQFQELALGLELSNHPFLWVVRPDMTDGSSDAYPDGFEARVAGRGRIVGWSPQQKVLAHPSVACFLTHCGWNSTMEGLSNGVPLLCWPYFADQFLNRTSIIDVWKVGLGFEPDSHGIISREEIKRKLEELFNDERIRARSLEMKEMARKSVGIGGYSLKNLSDFVEAMESDSPRLRA